MVESWVVISGIGIIIGISLIIIDEVLDSYNSQNRVCTLTTTFYQKYNANNQIIYSISCTIENNTTETLNNLLLVIAATAPSEGKEYVWDEVELSVCDIDSREGRKVDVNLEIPIGVSTQISAHLVGDNIELQTLSDMFVSGDE